jgi:hypothetical protein
MNWATDSSSLVLKNTPPATTTVPATETLPVQQNTQVEDQKDVPDPEADPNMPNLPEVTTEKDQQEEATTTKPGICISSSRWKGYLFNSRSTPTFNLHDDKLYTPYLYWFLDAF